MTDPVRPCDPLPMFCILTVRCDEGVKPASDAEAYDHIKSKLGLTGTQIDDLYGALPVAKVHPLMAEHMGKDAYLVLVNPKECWRLMEEKHPNVVGMHHAAMVYSGMGPQPMSAEDTQKLMKHRKPKGPQP
jgi:hypothetical protein